MSGAANGMEQLRAFERDLLYTVHKLERDTPPKGLAIKRELEDEYGEELNHSRLYQNLDRLVEKDLLSKGRKDDRTNEYTTTDTAQQLLTEHAKQRAKAVDLNRSDC